MMLAWVITTLLVAQLQGYCTTELSCFKSKLFNFNSPPEAYYNVSIFAAGASQNLYNAISFGDFNNDFRTDIIAVDANGINVYLWNNQSSSFDKNFSDSCASNSTGIILSTMACYIDDFNLDGRLDFVVYSQTATAGQFITYIQTAGTSLSFTQLTNPCAVDPVQPFLADLKMYNQQQLIAQIGGKRMILNYDQYVQNACPFTQLQWSWSFANGTNAGVPFSVPHQNSFLDYTGDCQADFLMMSQNGSETNLEFWVKNGQSYSLVTTLQVPTATLNSVSFGDLNYDGGVDLLLVNNSQLIVYYNKVKISKADDFCSSGLTAFPYEFGNPQYTSVTDLESGWTVSPAQQIVHLADINSDGYPDLLIQLQQPGQPATPYFLYNEAANTDKIELRTFKNPFQVSTGPSMLVGFFDLLENGIYDVFIVSPSYGLSVIYNNVRNPNYFFIKGYCLYGANADNYSIYSGASFFWVNTIDSSQKFTHIPQLFQTAYNSMQPPYVLNGLGRANNYVEEFRVGITGVNSSSLNKMWTPIIPNSQLIVASNPTPDSWSIRVFVLPTDSIVYVVIVTIVLLVVLGGVLIGFYWKDKKPQQEFLT